MATVRVKQGVACVAFVDGIAVPLAPDMAFDSSDQVVKEHPDMFEPEGTSKPARRVDSVPAGYVEQATAAPGERRNR